MADVVFFAIVYSLVMLGLGSWCVREGADILADYYDGSVVGGVVVSLLSNAPEVIFFLVALTANRDPSFAVGALSGSVIAECTFGLGMAIFLGALSSRSHSFALDKNVRALGQVLVLTTPLLICILVDGFCLSFGLLGALAYIGFVWFTVSGSSSARVTPKKREGDLNNEAGGSDAPMGKGLLFLAIGILIFALFSDDLVDAALMYGQEHHTNVTMLAFFLSPIAIATPELLDSVSLTLNGRREMLNTAIANITTSAICKTTLITGLLSLYGYFHATQVPLVFSTHLGAVSLVVLLAGCAVYVPNTLSRAQGLGLLALFLFGAIWQFRSSTPTPAFAVTSAGFTRMAANSPASVAASVAEPQFRDILSEINLTPYSA